MNRFTLIEWGAIAAYEAFRVSSADRLGKMPPWPDIPPDAQADWRAVADAVRMVSAAHIAAAERERVAAWLEGYRRNSWWRPELDEVVRSIRESP